MQTRYKKITVKVGSNVLAKADGTLNVARIAHLVDQIAHLQKNGVEVVLVSSGAVAAGRAVMKETKKSDAVSQRQLWAALGQVKLISRYSDFFHEEGLTCAQVLTTKENFSSRRHYLNMKNCITTLLENKVIPIVNENDTISVTELMFTDNDELSGLIASMVDSEALIILSNIDGVYTAHPDSEGAELIERIQVNDKAPQDAISSERSDFGRGGMLTKFRIAKKVAGDGIGVHVANGTRANILVDLLDKSKNLKHTFFVPNEKPSSGVKKWIGYSDGFTKGQVQINEGARKALLSDKAVSLLPVGIEKVESEFKKGDLIKITSINGEFVGMGKASYGSEKIEIEKQSDKQKPVIHYDYLYLEYKTNETLI
ncbi:glutamate 5-kinase [Draconibacterium orientale]|uniref:Glutamate 5-kinase n=1 Tax=Draconibacterium orientale TaxID=1168034 RepID=X5DAM8_9BACT|nr:glutamate 5-kinase [Draconibacterium orientale]AHW59828.1 gamma-glutamyl kinase [Draconibacterium orientale]SET18492.1 glutamate 5-kinase [Draconibacterium orientale]